MRERDTIEREWHIPNIKLQTVNEKIMQLQRGDRVSRQLSLSESTFRHITNL